MRMRRRLAISPEISRSASSVATAVPLRWITSTAAISGPTFAQHHPQQHLDRELGVGVQHLDHVGDDQRADERAAQHDAAGGRGAGEVHLAHELFHHRRHAQHADALNACSVRCAVPSSSR
jgi:hypothetical protein